MSEGSTASSSRASRPTRCRRPMTRGQQPWICALRRAIARPARLARSLASIGPLRAVYGERPPPAVAPLPGAVRTHLDQMTGRFGIYQHARGRFPDPGQGYCTDDVARAAIVDVLHGRQLGLPAIAESLARNVHFLAESVAPRSDRLRNFRDDDGNWLEREGSADAHARGVQALGVITGDST